MLPAERLVNMSTRARRYTTQAHVLACLQVVFHSASCQRTTLLHRQRKSSSTLYLTLLARKNVEISFSFREKNVSMAAMFTERNASLVLTISANEEDGA